MGRLVEGDDGLPVEEVGSWVKEKHEYLCRYIDISRKTRAKYIAPNPGGATYIDLFCGPGRSRIRETGEFVDGGVVAAWMKSLVGGAPFSQVFIADLDPERRAAAATRLRRLGAPVTELDGGAVQAAAQAVSAVNPHGLNFAFLDPFDLANLDFKIILTLSALKRIDMLVHVSQMDLQRNAVAYATGEISPFDSFAPGWREKVKIEQPQHSLRQQVFQFWRDKVSGLGVWTSTDMKLLKGGRNQPLYWLLLAARHDLAHAFWAAASNNEGQDKLPF